MILREFPNLGWLKVQAEESFASRKSWRGDRLPSKGWPNVILNVTSDSTIRDDIRGPLSIFTNLSGESHVEVDGKRVCVRDNTYFLSNHDQYYTLEIDKGKRAETFNIHFGEYFVDQVYDSLLKSGQDLLEGEFRIPNEPIAFHNRLSYRDEAMRVVIMEIRERPSPDKLWLEEKLCDLIQYLLIAEQRTLRSASRIPSIKSSTRNEILRRLFLVTDFIYENLGAELSLEKLAEIGCLSKFHLLRLFKVAFAKTPHQFITETRIAEARCLLQKTKWDVGEIGKAVGFDNASSFSRSFFNQLGVYPSQLRHLS